MLRRIFLTLLFPFLFCAVARGQSGQFELTTNQYFDLGWGAKFGVHNYFSERFALVVSGRMHNYSFYKDGVPRDDDPNTVLRPPHDSLTVPYDYYEVSGGLGLRFDLLRRERILIYIQPNIEASMMHFKQDSAYLSDLGLDFTGQIGLMVPITNGFSFQAELGLRYKGALYQRYESSYMLTTLSAGINYNISGFGAGSGGIFCPLADKGLMNLPNKEQAFLLEVPFTTAGEVGFGGRLTSYTRIYRAFYLSTLVRGSQVTVDTQPEDPNDPTASDSLSVSTRQRDLAVGLGLRWDFLRNDAFRVYLNPTIETGIFRIASPSPEPQTSKPHLVTTPVLGFVTSARKKVRFQAELGFRYRFMKQEEEHWRKSFIVLSAGLAFNIND